MKMIRHMIVEGASFLLLLWFRRRAKLPCCESFGTFQPQVHTHTHKNDKLFTIHARESQLPCARGRHVLDVEAIWGRVSWFHSARERSATGHMSEQVRHTDRCVAHNAQGKNSRVLDSTGRRSTANSVIVSPPSHYTAQLVVNLFS